MLALALMFKKTSPVRSKNTKIKRRVVDPKKRMLVKQMVVGLLVFSVFGLLMTGLWYGTRIKSLNISEVSVTGGETISHEVVKAKVEETLNGTYLGLIPRRFFLWYPHDEIETNLLQVSRIKDPQINKSSLASLIVSFDEYEPYALWCKDRNSQDCLFIDKNGYAFATAPNLTGGAFLRFHTIGTEPKVGQTMAQIADVAKMEAFVAIADTDFKLPINQIETDSSGDVFYIVSGGGELKATLKDETEKVVNNLQAILTSKEFKHIQAGNFQYIDLRFGNKVFVNEEKPGQATTTEEGISSAETTETIEPDKKIIPN